jgi:tRNA(Ile)-lysidine synthase
VSRAAASTGSCAGETWVLGLSGGADSTALADALCRLGRRTGLRVVAAHLDHGLRPGSARDAELCQTLCDSLQIPLRRGTADVAHRRQRDGGGLEEAARLERRAFLDEVRQSEGARFVVLAHTRDDQAETVLLRLLRGAGSRGLSAMRIRSGHLLRPLLDLSRQDVLAHLRARGLSWSDDPTNADRALLRNRVRHELLPYLETSFNPAIRESLARTAAVLAEETDVLDAVTVPEVRENPDGSASLLLSDLRAVPAGVARLAVRRALTANGGLRGIGLSHIERILALVSSPFPSGRRVALSGGREAVFHFDELRIAPKEGRQAPFAMPLGVPGRAVLPDGSALVAEMVAAPAAPATDDVIELPAGDLQVRTRRPGDRVHAQGRDLSLRRFLVERRVPAAQRERIPVVACGDQVVWVAGQTVEGPHGGDRFARLRLVAPAARTA